MLNGALLAVVLGLTTLTQITHAWGIGNFSFRYFLPATLVFGLIIAYGLTEYKWARGQLLSVALTAMAGSSIITIAGLKNTKRIVPAVGMTRNIFTKLDIAMTGNGFSPFVLWSLLTLLAVGLVITAVSLFVLSKPTKP
jgi:hypothetical protein